MLQRPNRASPHVPQAEHSGLARKVWALHHGRSRKAIVRVVPDADSPLYRVLWSNIGLSPPRCKDAAREWAERSAVTEHRKLSVAQRLKVLDNFSWSSLPIRFPSELGEALDLIARRS